MAASLGMGLATYKATRRLSVEPTAVCSLSLIALWFHRYLSQISSHLLASDSAFNVVIVRLISVWAVEETFRF